ncbi:MAG: beta strand repeat-containing protein [Methylocella sp.]
MAPAKRAAAVEPVPGGSCAGYPTNGFQWSGGPENTGVVNGMFCNTNWLGVINFQSSGRVGIGTTTPNRALHLYNATTDDQLVIEGDETHEIGLELLSKGPNGGAALGDATTKGWQIFTNGDSYASPNNFQIASWDGSSWKNVIAADLTGNVGIRNTAPGALLDIGTAGTILGTMRLEGNTSGYVQLQTAAAAGSWTMTLPVNAGTNGYVLQTNGSGVTSWVAAGAGSAALSALTAATATNTIANANYAQVWNWDTLTTGTAMALGSTSISSGNLLSLSSTGTAAASSTQTLLNIALSGTNATSAQTTYGAYISNTHAGATSANVGLYATATGGTAQNEAIYGLVSGTNNSDRGVFGYATAGTGNAIGVHGATVSTGNSVGVNGEANATTGTAAGVLGYSHSNAGYGGYFDNDNGGYALVTNRGNVGIGQAAPAYPLDVESATATYSGYFANAASGGVAVLGTANTGQSVGVLGATSSTTDNTVGVYGHSTGASGVTYGVLGDSASADGYGVLGSNTAADGRGVAGVANTGAGIGVFGATTSTTASTIGVYGSATGATGATYGVYGINASAAGTGGYFTNTGGGYALVTGTGNVGIANAAPGAKLDIGTVGALGTLRLEGNTSGYVQLQTAAAAGSWTATLPATAGSSGQQLTTDGAGVLSWAGGGTVATVDSTAQGANIGLTTLVTPGANNFYRVSCFVVLTRAATTSSVMPACNFAYTDESSTAVAATALTSTSVANAVGTKSSGTAVLYAKSGVAIQYSTTGFVTSGATTMQYAVHVRLELL